MNRKEVVRLSDDLIKIRALAEQNNAITRNSWEKEGYYRKLNRGEEDAIC